MEKKGVTQGARGKIFKNIDLIKERPLRIQRLSDMLEVGLLKKLISSHRMTEVV